MAYSAALGLEADLVDTTAEFYTQHFDCNVRGPIFLTQAAVPHLPRGGRVVFVSSAAARLGVAGQTVYSATKAADEAVVRVWAKELGQSHGITVNCVNPGPVATGKQFHPVSWLLKLTAGFRSMVRKRRTVSQVHAASDRVNTCGCSSRRGERYRAFGCLSLYGRCKVDYWCLPLCKWRSLQLGQIAIFRYRIINNIPLRSRVG